jgi:hypothetical protein
VDLHELKGDVFAGFSDLGDGGGAVHDATHNAQSPLVMELETGNITPHLGRPLGSPGSANRPPGTSPPGEKALAFRAGISTIRPRSKPHPFLLYRSWQ